MTHINIKISKAVATAEKDGIITTGMVGVPVSFMFDSWWDGLIVTAVFKGSGAPISVPLLGATDTVVPWEVLKRPSTLLRIGAEGRLPDGTLVIPTTWATVGIVMSGANATDDLAKPPTPTAFDRIMSKIGNMNDLTTEAKDNLVVAINEAMEKGGGVDVSGASVGQIIKVAAVDDTGKPTAWEPADLPEQAQSDWNQNDESQADFVKNRPFYEKIDSVTLMPETQFSNLTHIYSPEISTPSDVNGTFIDDFTMSSDGTMIVNTGDTVKVTFDGTVYECVRNGQWIGNKSLTTYGGDDTGEPFLFSLGSIPSFHTKSTDCVVKVEADISQIKKIDSKFLELPIAPGSGENSTIENCTANYYFYTKNTASGKYSHAEGASNSADGECSHAEGNQCSASGGFSHAEGNGSEATGYNSHAEGGCCDAEGYNSHAEGNNTKAVGDDSHSEGKGTIARGECQHVQGRYNVKDPTEIGIYAHIVGNGTDDDKRSNAHTLDWNGNAWFAGTVKVGGTGQDYIAAKTLATTEDIPTVDETLTKSGQAADAAAVGNRLSALSEEIANKAANVYIGPVQPTDGTLYWLDTSDSGSSGGETISYSITATLTNVTIDNAAESVNEGESFAAVLTASVGYELSSVKITMGGADITNTAYASGNIYISAVTGDVVITAVAVEVSGEVTTYTITNNLVNATSDNSAVSAEENASYTATLTATDGYTLEGATVTVTMGGTDITADVYADGVVNISAVTGDVVITVSAEKQDTNLVESNIIKKNTDTSDIYLQDVDTTTAEKIYYYFLPKNSTTKTINIRARYTSGWSYATVAKINSSDANGGSSSVVIAAYDHFADKGYVVFEIDNVAIKAKIQSMYGDGTLDSSKTGNNYIFQDSKATDTISYLLYNYSEEV